MQLHSNLPIVIVSGATGTGKTKLSIEIAKHYDGEVINVDALQIYKGMDIATNKATETECQGIVHHLLGFKDIDTLDFTVHDFQKLALDKISEIRSRNKMPILVGGTNYYIESVLWPKLVHVHSDNADVLLDSMSNEQLHDLLHSIDPQSAGILHPNNRRKVSRAISIATNSTQTQSSHLDQQGKSRRFPLNEVVFLWISAEVEAHFPRLDRRVEEMLQLGLLDELTQMQQLFQRICPSGQYDKGVFQAIGFKEFHEYLNCSEEIDENQRSVVLQQCTAQLKTANKQYVRTQNKWVNNRFLRRGAESENIPLFKLDSSDVTRWADEVFTRSVAVIEQIRQAPPQLHYSDFVEQLAIAPLPLNTIESNSPCRIVCDICDGQLFITQQQWSDHVHSARHQKRKRGAVKRAQRKSSGTVDNHLRE